MNTTTNSFNNIDPLYNIDRIFVISLDTAIERQEEFKKRFPEMIKLDIFEWFIVKRDNENTERGCYNSHKKIIDIAKERGYSQIITFEDDAYPLTSWEEFVNNINNIKYPENWKFIQLGIFPVKSNKTSDPNLYEVLCSYSCVSYITNVNEVDIPEYDENTRIPIDSLLFCSNYSYTTIIKKPQILDNIKNTNNYSIYPVLIRQNANKSTIGRSHDIIGQLNVDRNILLKISTSINLLCLIVFLIVFIVLILLIIIYYGYTRLVSK